MKTILFAIAMGVLLAGCEGQAENATKMLWAAKARCDQAPIRAQVVELDGEMLFVARCRIAPDQ